MERDEALTAIRAVAVEVLSVQPESVVETARFAEDLDADSLDLVELVMGLEERFDVSIPEEDLEGVATVGDAVDLVLAKASQRGMSETFDHRGRPRVAVTGVGLHTPAGVGLEANWATMLAGRSAARPITAFDASALAVRFACEVRDFDPAPYLGPKESRRVDRGTQLGFAAAVDALGRRR